jgi:hypothetical protein
MSPQIRHELDNIRPSELSGVISYEGSHDPLFRLSKEKGRPAFVAYDEEMRDLYPEIPPFTSVIVKREDDEIDVAVKTGSDPDDASRVKLVIAACVEISQGVDVRSQIDRAGISRFLGSSSVADGRASDVIFELRLNTESEETSLIPEAA